MAGRVVCAWTHFADSTNAGFAQPVYPDGCVDLLWRDDDELVVVGAMTRPMQAALRPGLRLTGVRLAPGQAAGLLGIPLSELRDREVALREIAGRGTFLEPLRQRQAPAGEELLERLQALFARAACEAADPWMRTAVRWLARRPSARLKDLAAHLEVSERQLNRRFAAAAGYGPKLLQRVLRFQSFLNLAAQSAKMDLAGLALEAGYSDQAHMNRDCRELAGRTPLRLLADAHPALGMSDLFNTDLS